MSLTGPALVAAATPIPVAAATPVPVAAATPALVGIGGIAGALARYGVGLWLERDYADTYVVNLLGSFALGALVAGPSGEALLHAAGTGFCGAFTTFSSAAVETVDVAAEADGNARAAAAAVAMIAGALLAAALGSAVGAAL